MEKLKGEKYLHLIRCILKFLSGFNFGSVFKQNRSK